MGFIDSHAHIDGEEFDLDRDEMIARAREAGAEAILVPAINMEGLDKLRSVVKTYPGFAYAMIGLHPEDVRPNWREVVDEMRRIQMEAPKEFIAIGEVGLDFYWSREYEHEQTKCFEEHVRWAIEAQLPLMIHCRKAQNEMVAGANYAVVCSIALPAMRRRQPSCLPSTDSSSVWAVCSHSRNPICPKYFTPFPSIASYAKPTHHTWLPCQCAASATRVRLYHTS